MPVTRELSIAEIRMLAECERGMDSGEIPFVMWRGLRNSVSKEAMQHFELKQGQTVTDQIMIAVNKFNIQSFQEKIAKRDTDTVLQKAQDAASKHSG